jgi:hypothetical protein
MRRKCSNRRPRLPTKLLHMTAWTHRIKIPAFRGWTTRQEQALPRCYSHAPKRFNFNFNLWSSSTHAYMSGAPNQRELAQSTGVGRKTRSKHNMCFAVT